MESMDGIKKSPWCPFDVIVVTSPDRLAAVAARELIQSSCCADEAFCTVISDTDATENDALNSIGARKNTIDDNGGPMFISSCDPYGSRLGSGGGTIAALAEAREAYHQRYHGCRINTSSPSSSLPEPTVLICHAGGESSRCPTQIALGKAWTSLPVSNHNNNAHDQGQVAAAVLMNPTSLLISTLSNIFRNALPKGSVVVAASDVILSFLDCNTGSNAADNNDRKIIHFEENHEGGGVFGLAVPAPLSTAKNHGVFVIDGHHDENKIANDDDYGNSCKLQSTYKVLQKPSIGEMLLMKNPSCVFQIREPNERQNEEEEGSEDNIMAWIDTGVITFLPDAVEALNELSSKTLKNCTRSGLTELYSEKYGLKQLDNDDDANLSSSQPPPLPQSLEEFARESAPKICLYGDILHSLQTTSSSSSASNPINRVDSPLLTDDKLFGALSKLTLRTCTIPEGSFVHLGTTSELIEFLVAGATSSSSSSYQQINKLQSFAKSIGISPRCNAFISGFGHQNVVADPSVILNSILIVDGCLCLSRNSSGIGAGAVIEHCVVHCEKIEVGRRCLLSGIRGDLEGRQLRVPSEMCLQVLPLRRGDGGEGFVCLCFGVCDGIKESTTLYGMEFNQVLQRSGLTPRDLWDESVPSLQRTLWNAKLHPILRQDEESAFPKLNFSFLEWIQSLRDDDDQLSPSAIQGLKLWKESKRIEISVIRECVDSEAEAKYRNVISSSGEVHQLNLITDCLLGRKHEPCTFDYLVDICNKVVPRTNRPEMKRLLKALDNISYHALQIGKCDVVGRTFMVMSEVLGNLHQNYDEPDSVQFEFPTSLTSESIAQVISMRDKLVNEEKYYSCCQLLEGFASMVTQRCISGEGGGSLFVYSDPLPLDTTATASAPARIDLAGGWSDTPPISFEHGGSVAILAVLVDGKRPLRAQSRVIRGKGIRLRTESRSLSDEETLLWSSEISIQKLADLEKFSNPESDCALLKCALLWLGLCPVEYIQNDKMKLQSIQPFLQKFCQREGRADVGLEIISCSLLPTGSGMGSSSILAGCIIASIAKCVGIVLQGMGSNNQNEELIGSTETNGTNSLIHGVLMVEQLLTSGGGWQDQIGGLVGGLKLATSDVSILPLQTKTRRFELTQEVVNEMNDRLILVDTGKPRLAKNILHNVLRRWARRSTDIVSTVCELVREASNAIDYATKGDLNNLGICMSKYWFLKKMMAGENSGVEPENVEMVLQLLTSSKKIAGGTLCGAGGGGFLALIAAQGIDRAEIESAVKADAACAKDFKWHYCTVATDGLLIEIV